MPLLYSSGRTAVGRKSSEGYLSMYDERTDTPVPLMKTFPQTGSIYKNCAKLLHCAQFEEWVIFCPFPVLLPPIPASLQVPAHHRPRLAQHHLHRVRRLSARCESRSCKNLLCAFDTAGAPVIDAGHDVEYLFSTTVDKSECRAILTKANFCELYKGWIDEHIPPYACPLNDLVRQLGDSPEPCAARIFLNR